ncbi:MAG TPA: hypothetical protein VFR37_06895 [Longimicrobium sp.]|nr:hypothetical protein [Longimicrobium sp.]
MMRAFARLAIVAFAVFAAAPPTTAQMEGSYGLVEVDGQPLPATSPDEEGVVMHRAILQLAAEGRFLLQAWATVGGDPEQEQEEFLGTWSVSTDLLTLTPDGAGEEALMRFRFTLAGDALRLHNGDGHEFTFRRQQ